MAAGQQILREYLFSLGFKVDAFQMGKFDKQLGGLDKTALKLGGSIAAIAAGAQAMVAVFAAQMEKLYYASKRTGASVGNLQALEYAGKQIGLSSGALQSSLENMARALRANPGLTALLENLGVEVKGRDKADVLTDLVAKLKQMPFYVAQQYAGLFGIDPDTLFMLEEGLAKLKDVAKERNKLADLAGLDSTRAAEAGMQYMNTLRQITERLGILKDMLSIKMLPVFKAFADGLVESLDNVINIFARWDKASAAFSQSFQGLLKLAKGDTSGFKDIMAAREAFSKNVGIIGRGTGPTPLPDSGAGGGRGFVNPPQVGGGVNPGQLFSGLEQQYKLPAGLLDKMWAQESGRGRHMLSPAGAMGHFQFMPKTAKAYGLDDPNDLTKSASAAAKMVSDLLRQYGGDLTKAMAAYNWGSGNLDKYGLAKMPAETLGYVNSVAGANIKQENTFNIYGNDPASTAKAVGKEIDRTWSDVTRNSKGALQ